MKKVDRSGQFMRYHFWWFGLTGIFVLLLLQLDSEGNIVEEPLACETIY
jgi:hypothetical protein